MPETPEIKHFIDGNWILGETVLEHANPADIKQVVSKFPIGTKQEVTQAAVSAAHAFERFKKTPAPFRGELIQNLGALVRTNKHALAQLIVRDTGKPIREALGSVQEVIDTCLFFASEGRRLYGHTVPSEMPNKRLMTYRRPLGVCGIITAGNFPIAVPAWYLVPALLCGNTIVWKPSEDSPTVAYGLSKLIEKAGFPRGTVNVVLGNQNTGRSLVELTHEGLIQKIGFTGGTLVGKSIGEHTGAMLQKPCLELGGKNPMVVMPDADLDAAVDAALFSAFGTAGQRCTSLGILLVQESIKDLFLDRFLEKVAQMAIGDPMNESVFYGPMMAKRFLENYERFCSEWIHPHHKVLTPFRGRITAENPWPNLHDANLADGYYAHPVIVDNVRSDDDLFREETFGPIVGITSFKTLEDATELANTSGYGLSASIFTSDSKAAFVFQDEVRSGMISINNSTSGAEAHLPFGGVGRSGNGSRQSGVWVLDEFTYWQSVNWDYSGGLQLAQMDIPNTSVDTGYVIDPL